MVARRGMPAGIREGSSTRTAQDDCGGQVIYAFVTGWWRRPSSGPSPATAIPRVMPNGAHTLTHQITCPSPTLHAVHETVDLHALP